MARFQGISAAVGLARGRIRVLRDGRDDAGYALGTPAEELSRLKRAIERSLEQLRDLAGRVDGEAAAILEFQCELLDDPDFLAGATNAVRDGTAAIDAWGSALVDEIAQYRSGSDDVLSARADDLADLKARVERNLLGVAEMGVSTAGTTEATVLVAEMLTPSRFLELDLDAIVGIATAKGSPTSHVCILARARAVPMVVGCGDGLIDLPEGTEAILDADAGLFVSEASEAELDAFDGRLLVRRTRQNAAHVRQNEPAVTANGEPVRIYANVDRPRLLAGMDVTPFDGVGLVRTEFLFEDGLFPDEQQQYEAYCAILRWADGRPVTIRVLDVGGDKPIAGLTLDGEANPFLGVRGIRLLRYRPDIFRTQLRALARAAVHGDLKVMVPMVSVPRELAEFRVQMAAVISDLSASGASCRLPPIGMMVEVPSAALTAADFDADFFSIGTNDLTQYTLAAARDEYRLNELVHEGTEAVSKLIEMVVEAGRRKNVEVSVCGDMASVPEQVAMLLQAGVRSLSLAPASVAAVKEGVRGWIAQGR
jgi:phosphoenolpyruvate-protein phosphotransferase (PTS system enzyme I)